MAVTAPRTERLRALDWLEEMLWLLEQRAPRAPALVAELEGETTVRAWTDAMHAVQRKYPLLSVRIGKIPGERPFFTYLSDAEVPFEVVPLAPTFSVEDEMERAMNTTFGDGSGALFRLTLFHAPSRCVVLLVSHHAAFDGKTNLMILLDLLAAVAGEALGPSIGLAPTLSALLGLRDAGPYRTMLMSNVGKPQAVPAERVRVKRLQLSPEKTNALVRDARAAGTSVQGALVAAMMVAGGNHRESWRTQPISYGVPIDVRPLLFMPATPGLLVSGYFGEVQPMPQRSFWDLARTVSRAVATARTREEVLTLVLRGRQLMEVEYDPTELLAMYRQGGPLGHELVVTNYGAPQKRTAFGPLTLKALSASSPAGNTQKVSAITVDDRMMLTHVSPDPFPSLLEHALAVLTDASG